MYLDYDEMSSDCDWTAVHVRNKATLKKVGGVLDESSLAVVLRAALYLEVSVAEALNMIVKKFGRDEWNKDTIYDVLNS